MGGDELEIHGAEGKTTHKLKTTFETAGSRVRLQARDERGMDVVKAVPVKGRLHTWIDGKEIDEPTAGVVEVQHMGAVVHGTPAVPDRMPACVVDKGRENTNSTELMQRYSDAVRKNLKRTLIDVLTLTNPEISDIEILTDDLGESTLWISTKDGLRVSMESLGAGAYRLLGTYLSFCAAQGGVILVDELENGVHHSVLPELWSRIRTWSREWEVQVFVTTHSAECLNAAIAAFSDAPGELCVQQLYRNKKTGMVRATTFTSGALEGAADLNLEMR